MEHDSVELDETMPVYIVKSSHKKKKKHTNEVNTKIYLYFVSYNGLINVVL